MRGSLSWAKLKTWSLAKHEHHYWLNSDVLLPIWALKNMQNKQTEDVRYSSSRFALQERC